MSKPIVESMINTSALALTSYGVLMITTKGGYYGFISILAGLILEFVKYYGRKIKLW